MMKVLVVIDMQKDFIDGSLGTKEAQAIVPRVIEEIQDPSYNLVYATMDTHQDNYLETFEGKHLPVKHCIRDTEGWKIHPDVEQALNERSASIIYKPTFGSKELMNNLIELYPSEITIVGLCTDICVISNALLLRASLYQTPITVLKDACAGVTVEKHNEALDVMKSCQIDIR